MVDNYYKAVPRFSMFPDTNTAIMFLCIITVFDFNHTCIAWNTCRSMQSFLRKYSHLTRYTYRHHLCWLYLHIKSETFLQSSALSIFFLTFTGKGTRFHCNCAICSYNAGTSVYESTNLWAMSFSRFPILSVESVLCILNFDLIMSSPPFQLTSFPMKLACGLCTLYS
jgi:hypothetical protein